MQTNPNPLKPPSKSEKKRLLKLIKFEKSARALGFQIIAGIDEAGRGPLAGPLVASACIIEEDVFFPGINDSKLLKAEQRETLYHALVSHPGVSFGVGIVEPDIIDKINIYQATLFAMKMSVEGLKKIPDYLLVDGLNFLYPNIKSEKIIKGDSLSQSIAAASIIAKKTRDQLMVEYHRLYPQYGFHEHKGYSTEKHVENLKKHGPCPIHRKSFAPVREICEQLTFL